MSYESDQISTGAFFEIELIKMMTNAPSDEVAADLASLIVRHKLKGTKISEELKLYMKSFISDLENSSKKNKALEIVKYIGRPLYEHKHIAMNSITWELILSGYEIAAAYNETGRVFNTNDELPRLAFERKSHDFGKRELCRIGLDVFIIMYNHYLSIADEKIIENILEEPLLSKTIKDEIHLKKKYKDLLNAISKK